MQEINQATSIKATTETQKKSLFFSNKLTTILIITLFLAITAIFYLFNQNYKFQQQILSLRSSSQYKLENTVETNDNSEKKLTAKYIFHDLGISFQFLENNGAETPIQIENRICLDDQLSKCSKESKGQYVEVFKKNPNDSIEEAINKLILANLPKEKCQLLIKTNPEDLKIYLLKNLPDNYTTAEIIYEPEIKSFVELGEKQDSCPSRYTETNGQRYFLVDSKHPDKLLFFHIGLYKIQANYNQDWEETIEFLD